MTEVERHNPDLRHKNSFLVKLSTRQLRRTCWRACANDLCGSRGTCERVGFSESHLGKAGEVLPELLDP